MLIRSSLIVFVIIFGYFYVTGLCPTIRWEPMTLATPRAESNLWQSKPEGDAKRFTTWHASRLNSKLLFWLLHNSDFIIEPRSQVEDETRAANCSCREEPFPVTHLRQRPRLTWAASTRCGWIFNWISRKIALQLRFPDRRPEPVRL